MASALLLAACGGEGDATGREATPTESPASDQTEPILIETRVSLRVEDPRYNSKAGISPGDLLNSSAIGDSPFCSGGAMRDRHGSPEVGGLVDRTFDCRDGTLRIAFTPGMPEGRTQSGLWHVVSGTGAYEGWEGGGEMEITYDRGSDTKGNETFKGTITR
jgi:hypothetical protein